jgi:hypothetical protein
VRTTRPPSAAGDHPTDSLARPGDDGDLIFQAQSRLLALFELATNHVPPQKILIPAKSRRYVDVLAGHVTPLLGAKKDAHIGGVLGKNKRV